MKAHSTSMVWDMFHLIKVFLFYSRIPYTLEEGEERGGCCCFLPFERSSSIQGS